MNGGPPPSVDCARCGKRVGAFDNGTPRPHAVPREKRKDPNRNEMCVGVVA